MYLVILQSIPIQNLNYSSIHAQAGISKRKPVLIRSPIIVGDEDIPGVIMIRQAVPNRQADKKKRCLLLQDRT